MEEDTDSHPEIRLMERMLRRIRIHQTARALANSHAIRLLQT